MPWVRFDADFDWSPRHGSTIAYKKGMVLNVTRRCRDRAIELKRGVAMQKPNRHAEPMEVNEHGNP